MCIYESRDKQGSGKRGPRRPDFHELIPDLEGFRIAELITESSGVVEHLDVDVHERLFVAFSIHGHRCIVVRLPYMGFLSNRQDIFFNGRAFFRLADLPR